MKIRVLNKMEQHVTRDDFSEICEFPKYIVNRNGDKKADIQSMLTIATQKLKNTLIDQGTIFGNDVKIIDSDYY